MSTDAQIEQEIQAKGKTAPRITPADIEANIVEEVYFTAAEGTLGAVIAQAKEHSPEIVVGSFEGAKAPLDLLTFDAEIGRKVARANAVQKIWPLMGYELRGRLAVIAAADNDFPLGKASAISSEGSCEACQ
jgi:hypothetical protein